MNGLHLPVLSIIRMMICWLQNKDTITAAQDSAVSVRSIVKLRLILNAAAVRIIESTSERIGGPDRIVEINECNLPRAKYHIGRIREDQWVLCGIMRPLSSSEQPGVFIVSVPDRKKETLLKIIKTWVHPGSIIITDCWNGYLDLQLHGYRHFVVNHSENFVDPTSLAHTQRIESLWRWVRRKAIPATGCSAVDVDFYLAGYLYRNRVKHDIIQFLKDMFSLPLSSIET